MASLSSPLSSPSSSVFLLLLLFLCSSLFCLSSSNLLEEASAMAFDEGYIQIFGGDNLMVHKDGSAVQIALDHRTGAGFASQDLYHHGFFSASIKLPSDYAAGVVVAFYMSNGDIYEKNHDELDFEFLGNIRGREWRVQTNVYGNGSTTVGREERYSLWFDPTEDFHRYSILWSHNRIIFYIDNVPIREVVRNEATGAAFPSKPMSLYATIWDGSKWATNGGRYKVNYKYAPYVAEFSELVLHGCAVNPLDHISTCEGPDSTRYDTIVISTEQREKMKMFRREHLSYSYCYDRSRYTKPPSDCTVDPKEAAHLDESGGVTFGYHRHRGQHHRHRHGRPQGQMDVAM